MYDELQLLKKLSIFRSLNDKQKLALIEVSKAVFFAPDYLLFEEESRGSNVYFIMEGEVELTFSIGEAGETKIDLANSGQIIGCSLLFHPHTYNATARSLSNIKVLSINVDSLDKLCEKDYLLAVSFYKLLIQNLLKRVVNLRLKTGSNFS